MNKKMQELNDVNALLRAENKELREQFNAAQTDASRAKALGEALVAEQIKGLRLFNMLEKALAMAIIPQGK